MAGLGTRVLDLNNGLAYQNGSWRHYTGTTVASYFYLWVAYVIVISLVTGRYAKFEFSSQREQLLESKKQHVRVISHEVRTPLNIAFVGLQLLEEDLKNSDHVEDRSRLDTITDVKSACQTALEILNDILNYDKIEDGNILLDSANVPAKSFVKCTVRNLVPAAKAKGISLKLNFNVSPYTAPSRVPSESHDNHHHPHRDSDMEAASIMNNIGHSISSSLGRGSKGSSVNSALTCPQPLSVDDTLKIDVTKVGTVIRNVVLNAIKFTPPGGTIAVNVRKRISTSRNSSTAFLVIDVVDSGVGMTMMQIDEAFSSQSRKAALSASLRHKQTNRTAATAVVSSHIFSPKQALNLNKCTGSFKSM
jgi:signal transduction histidine kinase